eukprot:TRINITY_DN1215_c1_g1_i3.p1 TRINITY_DN1215_c1_g1~~TRINITY_DN1215_c1_g1_i3.p1  ORF type:complete len:369 (+),score=60.99 TRINITY_DN1215_c1_g1_i3:146-1252(+)
MALHHHVLAAVALLACLPLLTQAAFSPEEAALRKAITNRGASTYTLTKNIVLTADLPLMANGKVLKVQSRRGAQFTINGQNKYLMFRSATEVFNPDDAIVDLTLVRLVITGAKEAVKLVGEGTKLSIDSVNFNKNERALTLQSVNGKIVNSQFSKHKRSAIVFTTFEGFGDKIDLTNCNFISNSAEEGSGGGAIRVSLYATVTADRCFFSKNTAEFGGAVTSNRRSLFIVKNSKFDSNLAKKGGGAISLFRGDAEVSDTTFTKNTAESVGGGAIRVASDDEAGSEAILKNVAFVGNQAKTTLGGAFLLDSAAIRICNVRFASNFGNGVPNNGFVTDSVDNVLTTSGETVPLLVVSPTAALATGTFVCP